jgi:hypothetical protein
MSTSLLRLPKLGPLGTLLIPALIVVMASATARPASAGDRWLSLAVMAGATRPDTDLANYRWDVGGRAAWGAQALLGKGRWGTGLRWSRWNTSQSTGLLGVEAAPSVHLTSWKIVGQLHALSFGGVRVLGMASVGRVHMAYEPDQLILNVEGASEPLVVDFEPIDEWILGAGVAVDRNLYSGFSLGAELERTSFSLDTAHRIGGVIEEDRESFGNWNLRLRLSWALRM